MGQGEKVGKRAKPEKGRAEIWCTIWCTPQSKTVVIHHTCERARPSQNAHEYCLISLCHNPSLAYDGQLLTEGFQVRVLAEEPTFTLAVNSSADEFQVRVLAEEPNLTQSRTLIVPLLNHAAPACCNEVKIDSHLEPTAAGQPSWHAH